MRMRLSFGCTLMFAIVASILPTTMVFGEKPLGPEYKIVAVKTEGLDSHIDKSCQDYFVRSDFGGGLVVIKFYYKLKPDDTQVVSSSSALGDLTYNIDPAKTSPMAQIVSGQGANTVWQLNMSKTAHDTFETCLAGIKMADKK